MMAKITNALGPTNADEPDDGARVEVQEPILPGEPAQDYGEPSEEDAAAQGAGKEDENTDPDAEARALYEAQTVEDLKAELKERDRGLAVTGNKPELVDRLIEDDARQAAQHDAGGR